MKERPLTTAEAAEFLSVSEWAVRDYINSGLLRAHKWGNGSSKKGSRRPWRIWQKDLIEFVNRHSNVKG